MRSINDCLFVTILYMRNSFLHRQLISWIACLCLLFNGFVPAIAVAPAGKPVTGLWVEICSANGNKSAKLIAIADDTAQTDQMQEQHGQGHCANCLPHADHAVFINTALKDDFGNALRESYPPLFYHAPQRLFSWASSQPRAPPLLA